MDTIPFEMDSTDDENDDVVTTRLPDLDDLDLDGNLEPMMDSRHDESNEQAEGDEPLTDNPELLAKLKSLKGASKNVQKRTFIKLDATRLTGERGIPILPKIFKNVKLKGKHHEAEDLKTIMHHLEHWGHRLFPKMPFAEVLDRAERLGAKKAVQTCVKRIRLGMPVLESEFVEDEQDVRRGGHSESEERDEESTIVTNTSIPNQVPNDDEIDEFLGTAAELEREQNSQQSPSHVRSLSSQKENNAAGKPGLSEEAKARIERNKKLAMEKRAARLAKANKEQTSNAPLALTKPDDLLTKEVETAKGNDSYIQHNDEVEMLNDRNGGLSGDTYIEKENDATRTDLNLSQGSSKKMDIVSPNSQGKGEEEKQKMKDNMSRDDESINLSGDEVDIYKALEMEDEYM